MGLVDGATAINQYFVQAKMCKKWGLLNLAKKHHEESLGKMKRADRLIDRMLLLEGVANIARYDVIRVGTDVKQQFGERLEARDRGVEVLPRGDEFRSQVKDAGSREILEHILRDSEERVDWLEVQLGLITEAGLSSYLSESMKGE